MKKLTYTLLVFALGSLSIITTAQPVAKESARAMTAVSETAFLSTYSSTDWVSMMRDHKVNIHDVKKAFNQWYQQTHGLSRPGAGESEEDESYEAYRRWEWYNLPRADVHGNRPDLYQIASDYDNYLHTGFRRSLMRLVPSSAAWTYAGNTSVPTGGGGDGRVNRIRLMPGNNSTMFACTPEGGLWKTTNGGTSWSENTDQLGDLSTSDIAINPLKTNIMYLATGDGDGIQSIYPTPATIGILKSFDGGTTWSATSLAYSLSLSGADFYSVNEILIDPQDTSVILAATTFGIWRSANSGATWTLATGTGTGSANWFHSMEFEPGHPSIVYAGTSNVYNPLGTALGANFYRSTNNGISWAQVTSGLPSNTDAQGFEIGVSAADTNDVYLLACNSTDYGYLGLYLSTNDGVSFTTRSTTPDILGWEANGGNDGGQGWYTLSMAVSQTNIDSVWVGGVNIWASSNGGTSWQLNANWEGTPYVHADIHAIQFIPGTNSKGYVVGCDGGVFITSNSGNNWTDISNNLEIAQQYCVGPSASTAGAWITGWQDNGTNFSTTPWSQVYGGDGMYCFIDWNNNNNYFAETGEGGLVKSTNAGGTWNGATNGISNTELNDAPWVTVWMQDPRTSTTLYSGFCNVWKSTNSGGNWTQLSTWGPESDTNVIMALAVDSSNDNYIYAAQHNIIEMTTNGGTSWTNITGGLPVNSTNIAAIAVDSKSPTHVWVTFAGYSAGNQVFASINGGATWTNISAGLPNLPVNCIVSESGSPEAIYVGTDQGVYYHDTLSNNWTFYNTGLPMVMVADLKIYRPGKQLIAATYGRGTWQTLIYSPCVIGSVTANVTTNVICNGGANGSASSTASGGASPYTYIWTSGSSSSTAAGLSAGTYTLIVVDNAGCYGTASITITQPAAVGVSIASQTDANCGAGGSATANAATGGTSPYTYMWSGGAGAGLTASNLSAGTYTITATDNNGCTGTASVTITQSASGIGVSIASQSDVSCNGGNNGSATVNPATGGISPYTYSWSESGGTDITASNLSGGTYTITVTDNNGCNGTASVTITEPAALGINIASQTNVTCNSAGSATATSATGGTSPYTYLWSNGGTELTATNLGSGTYTISVTDNSGCLANASVTITQSASSIGISLANQTNVSCNGGNDGSVTANAATGGTSPYTYSWSGGEGANLSISNLVAGSYSIVAIDSNGCSASAIAVITQPASLSITADSINATGGNCNGSAWVVVGGGTNPYTYLWTGGLTTDTISNQCVGDYCCTITDNNGCMDSVCNTIEDLTGTKQLSDNSGQWIIYPNPNNGKFTIQMVNGKLFMLNDKIQIYNVLGQEVYSQFTIHNSQFTIDLSSQSSGVYFYRLLKMDGSLIGAGKIVIQK